MAQEKAKRTYASRANACMIRAAEEALSEGFHIGFESANACLKNNSFYFVESVMTKTAHNGALDKV